MEHTSTIILYVHLNILYIWLPSMCLHDLMKLMDVY